MIAPSPCEHTNYKKDGKNRNGTQRYKCKECGVRFSNDKPLGSMRTSVDKAAMALSLMLEGMSVRATERLTGICRQTLCDLILVAGEKCEDFFNACVKNVTAKDIQCDEIWSFCGMKAKQASARNAGPDQGDSWTYVAIDRDTKMILAYHVGQRDGCHTDRFWASWRMPLTAHTESKSQQMDGAATSTAYRSRWAATSIFGMLIKKYAASQTETRYSPATIMAAEKVPMFGNPDEDRICTSHIESLNQKIRMHLRRFTRLTAAHSKSIDHHVAMQAIFFCWYNFCRKTFDDWHDTCD